MTGIIARLRQLPGRAARARSTVSGADAESGAERAELCWILDDLYTRNEDVSPWEYCQGAMTALLCCPNPNPPLALAQYLPALLYPDAGLQLAQEPAAEPDEEGPLPPLPAFADAAQQARFVQLWHSRWRRTAAQLDAFVDYTQGQGAWSKPFQPDAIDHRGMVASMTGKQRAAWAEHQRAHPPTNQHAIAPGQLWVPAAARVWAVGFMFVVSHWPRIWAVDGEHQAWFDERLNRVDMLAARKPEVLRMRGADADTVRSDAIGAVHALRHAQRRLGTMPTMDGAGDGQK